MREEPTVSLVICTRNRAGKLGPLLSALDSLSSNSLHEIVLVDNGSTDGTAAVLQAYAARTTWPVRLVNEPVPGLSRARNAGVAVASGSIVTFTDDDCYPAPDFIARVAEAFSGHDIDFLGGRVLLFDVTDAPVTIQPSETPVLLEPRQFLPPGVIHGANMSIRLSAARQVGGFDVLLGAGTQLKSGEDIEFLQRLLLAGFKGAYLPAPVVWHHHGRKSGPDIERLIEGYAIGRGAYLTKLLLLHPWSLTMVTAVARKLIGNLIRRDVSNLRLELQGARCYVRAARDSRKA